MKSLKIFSQDHSKIQNPKTVYNLFARRMLILYLLIIAGISVLLVNLYNLQITNYENYQTQSNGNRIKILPIVPTRGVIYAKNNEIVAQNLTFFGLYMTPEKVVSLDKTFKDLAGIIDISAEDIAQFKKNTKNNPSYSSILLKGALTELQIAKFAVNQYKFPSLEIKPYFKRSYPYKEVMSAVLGYVGKINDKDLETLKKQDKLPNYAGTTDIGKLGIERYYEDILHGAVGFEEVETNSLGKVVRKLSQKKAISGQSIHLTIDLDLQRFIIDLLKDQNGAVVAIEPSSGKILAMVSNPSYDNNLFVDGISYQDYDRLLNDPNRPLYNRTTQGIYPPASTVKPFMSIAALTEGVITPQTEIFDPGYWVLPNTKKTYRDWLRYGHGKTNLLKAIEESSDTFFYQTGFNLGIDRIYPWMKKFGFGSKLDIDLYEQYQATLPNRQWKQDRFKIPWYQGDTIPVAIGQGYWTATPLQLAFATTILVNNGKVKRPHLLEDDNEDYSKSDKFTDITGVKQQYWNLAKQGMHLVVQGNRGTARKAFAKAEYKAAGKSGTAQVFGLKENANYDASKLDKKLHDHALFTSFAPFEKPQIVLAIILENAGGGSSNAAPIARSILDYYLVDRPTKLDKNSP